MSDQRNFLRPSGPTTWEVHIPSPFDYTPDPEHLDLPEVQGVWNGPVATIEGSVALVALDPNGNTIGTGLDRTDLARRIASGDLDNDFRFEIIANPEPDDPASMFTVHHIAMPSQKVIDSFGTDRPYDAVESAREVQAVPDTEERWAMYAERGW